MYTCQAISQKKLFIIDCHDPFLLYMSKVRQIEGTTLYRSWTLLFLTPGGTLWPLAIELTWPPMDGKPQWKQVFTPCWDSTSVWLWRLAKARVLAHKSSYHQQVSHWYVPLLNFVYHLLMRNAIKKYFSLFHYCLYGLSGLENSLLNHFYNTSITKPHFNV